MDKEVESVRFVSDNSFYYNTEVYRFRRIWTLEQEASNPEEFEVFMEKLDNLLEDNNNYEELPKIPRTVQTG